MVAKSRRVHVPGDKRKNHHLAKPHDYRNGVCKWCAMRSHWPGAKEACPMLHKKNKESKP